MSLKQYKDQNVFDAAESRVATIFDRFENIYVSFSGGKDSSVMTHMVMREAIKRNRRVGVLIIDLEAQYKSTIEHVTEMVNTYRDNIDLYWVCLPMALRNAVSNYEPRWCCWEDEARPQWVREFPLVEDVITDVNYFDFFVPGMEFEEFMVLFGVWFGKGSPACGFVGIRADESLNRFRTIASSTKECLDGMKWTTKVEDNLYNAYPIYDWRTEDIWRFHGKNPELCHNPVYDMMHKAGLSIHQMRLCQPYGDDQKKGLWLYHILEPETWAKIVARVNGANSGALYVSETGNVSGSIRITKPTGHTWKSFCDLLLAGLPEKTREHYLSKFRSFIKGWKVRGYIDGIPDEAPAILEAKHWAPSYRRLCKCLLRNDWWCKGLGLTQPKSAAYGKYLEIKKAKQLEAAQP